MTRAFEAPAAAANWRRHYDVANADLAWQYKGWPRSPADADLDSVAELGLNLFADDFMFPVMVISHGDLMHNIEVVARFCADSGVSLSPHGKTTMSPELSHLQLEAGAWAITASTGSQARIFRAFDIGRILIAHQVVDPAAVRWMADELAAHPDVELFCLIDSVECVEAMEAALAGRPAGRPIGGLVELGMTGGRTGCRTIHGAVAVAERIAASERVRLVGVEGYEGILHFRGDDFSEVDEFLHRMRELTERLADAGHFDHLDEVIVTAGGSMFPDRVVAILGGDWDIGRPVRPVIRPGGYATHDSKMYTDSGPFGVRAPMDAYPALRAALTLWSYVVSRPEPNLALLGFGKRDGSYDVDLPMPETLRRDGETHDVARQLEVFELNDQHAFVRLEPDFDLRVGDQVGCGISHPCTSFDRWRAIPVTDDDHNIVSAVRTFF